MQSPEHRDATLGPGMPTSPSKSSPPISNHSPAATAAASNPKKPRSCAVCRSRKVRCDKLSPCTNCRRAGIACVVPQPDRLPRWARRLDRATLSRDTAGDTTGDSSQTPHSTLLPPPTPQVLERLRNLEALVRELNSQLKQAQAGTASSSDGPSPPSAGPTTSPEASTRDSEPRVKAGTSHVQGGLGRLAINDSHSSRYVSNSFWIRIKDEIDGLEVEARDQGMNDWNSSDDDDDDQGESGFGGSMAASERRLTGGTLELDRTPAERHAFMFRHNLSAAQPRLEDFRPLPSQVPFLINVFHENVNSFVQVVHVPTVHKMAWDVRKQGGASSLSPSDEALLFSIYYVAITSMEDEDVIANFGTTKNDLNLKFRCGFEHALARADFLNSPNLTLVQALAAFLFLVRRYDSPRYVWMMVGVAIRMAQSLGLHRDGASFPGLSPFEIETRRRVWWALYILDLRSSEDQGTSMTIIEGNFDTRRPLSINDDDISPQTTELPPEREGYTDMTMPGIYIDTAAAAAKLLSVEISDGIPDIEHHGRLVIESYAVLERYGAQIGNARYRMAMVIASLVVAKTTLILYLPVVAAAGSPGTPRTEDISRKLLVSSIEVAEFNHELSADMAFRNWHWLCQTHSHWYAIVYILMRISARPWSPTSERAWTALRSPWLIPKYPEHVKRNNQVIVPLRRLMAKSQAHRASELQRLRLDPVAAQAVEEDDKNTPTARSHGIDVILDGGNDDVQAYYLEKWRQLLVEGGAETPAQLLSSSSASPRALSNVASANASGGGGMSGTEAGHSAMSLSSFDTSPSHAGSGVSNALSPGTLIQASTSFHSDPGALVTARNQQQQQQQQQQQPQQASGNSEYGAPKTADDNSRAPPLPSSIGPGDVLESWLWADADLGGALPSSSGPSFQNDQAGDWADTTMNNFDADMNWLDLIESAKDMEWEALPQTGGMW